MIYSTTYDNYYADGSTEEIGVIVIVPCFWYTGKLWWKKKVRGWSVRQSQEHQYKTSRIVERLWTEIGLYRDLTHAEEFVDVMKDIRVYNGGERDDCNSTRNSTGG